jgi:hypothetical protein
MLETDLRLFARQSVVSPLRQDAGGRRTFPACCIVSIIPFRSWASVSAREFHDAVRPGRSSVPWPPTGRNGSARRA